MAAEVCMEILEEIRASSLNFVISETPYSAYISLRKRFVKNSVPKSKSSLLSQSEFQLQVENEALKKQVQEVLSRLEESEASFDLAHDTIEILESEAKKAESKLFEIMKNSKAALDDKKEEINVLNGVIKSTGDETLRIKNENKKLTKGAKAHEKEIYNLENKNENQRQTIKNLRESLNSVKSEKKKLENKFDKKSIKPKAIDSNSNCLENNYIENPAEPVKTTKKVLSSGHQFSDLSTPLESITSTNHSSGPCNPQGNIFSPPKTSISSPPKTSLSNTSQISSSITHKSSRSNNPQTILSNTTQTISSSTSQASLPSKENSSKTYISISLHLSSSSLPLMNHSASCQTSSKISNQLSEEQDDPKVDDDTPKEEWSHLSPIERAVLRSLSTILKFIYIMFIGQHPKLPCILFLCLQESTP
jgi:hypothetical protein